MNEQITAHSTPETRVSYMSWRASSEIARNRPQVTACPKCHAQMPTLENTVQDCMFQETLALRVTEKFKGRRIPRPQMLG